MSEFFPITAVGLAVDDVIFYARGGVSYVDLQRQIPLLPEKEGDLNEVGAGGIDRALEQVRRCDLLERSPCGIYDFKCARNLGGGFNGLVAVSRLARDVKAGNVAACFALGSDGSGNYDSSAKYMLAEARKLGIDVSQCFPIKGESARTVAIARRNEDGKLERTFVHNPGVANDAVAGNYKEAMTKQTGAAIFYYLNIAEEMCASGAMGIRELFSALRQRDIITVLDSGGNRDRMNALGMRGMVGSGVLEKTHIFAPSHDEVGWVPGENNLDRKARLLGTRDYWGPGIIIFKKGIYGNEIYGGACSPSDSLAKSNLDFMIERCELDAGVWERSVTSSPAIKAKKSEHSVGAGDKSLALGVFYLVQKFVSNPAEIGRIMNVGGALAISGKDFSLENVDELFVHGQEEVVAS